MPQKAVETTFTFSGQETMDALRAATPGTFGPIAALSFTADNRVFHINPQDFVVQVTYRERSE